MPPLALGTPRLRCARHASMARDKNAWCIRRGVAHVRITRALFAQPGTTLIRRHREQHGSVEPWLKRCNQKEGSTTNL